MKFTVKRFDSLGDKINKKVKQLSSSKHVTVGIHADSGTHPDAKMTNAKLGAIQHFGADKIPARPFLDVGVAKGKKLYAEIVKNAVAKGFSETRTLNQIGSSAAGSVKEYMTDLKTPPNSPKTIKAKKGKDNPLIDTGELRASVTYKIQSGKPRDGIT